MNGYDMCPMQFFITYNLGIDSGSGKAANKGTVIHKVMEVLAGLKLFEQDNPKKRKLILDDDALGEIKINKSELRTEEYIDSLLEDCYKYYTDKCEKEYTNADFKFCVKWLNEALTFDGGRFDPRNQDIFKPEQRFDIEIKEPWAKLDQTLPDGTKIDGYLKLKGTIDLLVKEDEKTLQVIDYKTGQRKNWATGEVKEYEYLDTDPQLLLYYYALKRMYPEFETIIMTIYYVRDGGPYSFIFDEEHEKIFLEKLKEKYEQVTEDTSPRCVKYSKKEMADGKPERNKCFMCRYKKDNWPGTNTKICDFVETTIKYVGMDRAIEDCKEEGFEIDYYHAPGS
jgi:ATP-dependent helicase/DNAse subunit B